LKIFISSVIRGFEEERSAAARAAKALDHTVLRSEDFGAIASSAQRACRAAVRDADLVILIMGAAYGLKDPVTGKSPTHEEFEEAQQTGRDVLVFVQQGVQREPDQDAFVREVREWAAGANTGSFRDADMLRDSVTQALSRHERTRSAGPIDLAEIAGRLEAAMAGQRGRSGSPVLCVALVGAPRQVVLTAGQLEDGTLQAELEREALYGATAVLERGARTRTAAERGALVIAQEDRRVTIDGLGAIAIWTPAQRPRDERDWMPTLIDEDVRDAIAHALRYGHATLDRLDPYERLADIAVGATIRDLGHLGWRTRAERDRSPNTTPMNMRGQETVSARLEPLSRKRPAVRQQGDDIARDLTAILRRAATE